MKTKIAKTEFIKEITSRESIFIGSFRQEISIDKIIESYKNAISEKVLIETRSAIKEGSYRIKFSNGSRLYLSSDKNVFLYDLKDINIHIYEVTDNYFHMYYLIEN